MKIKNFMIYFVVFFALISCSKDQNTKIAISDGSIDFVRNVELKKNDYGNYRLFVDNEEFYVSGAGLEFGNQKVLASHGANAFRTWCTENGRKTGQEVLDEAQSNGLMVFMGIEMGSERHGFSYEDENRVRKQKETIKESILKYKDHPALLGWGIGNELNLQYTNTKVWDAVNDISLLIHELDPNHPTTTMLAGISKELVGNISAQCDDLDFISIQMYGDMINLQQRIEEAGYDGPYMVTEWGAIGHWEVGSTEWGAPIEQTSTERAEGIKKRYEAAIEIDKERCLGSFVFLWGQKQERTPTWYGLFTENEEEMQAIDQMHYYWNNGEWPKNQTPSIKSVLLNEKSAFENIHVGSNENLSFLYEAEDPDNDELTWRFEVMEEATDLKVGGDRENKPMTIPDRQISAALGKVIFKAPEKSGAYRAFIYVLDGNNHAGTANIPFFVD